jgi:uncharacterized protein
MKRASLLYAIVFAVSCLYFLLYSRIPSTWMTLYLFVAMWIPGIVSIIYLKQEKKSLKEGLVWSLKLNRFFWIGLLAPVGLMGLVILLSFLITPTSFGFPSVYIDAFEQASIPRSLYWPVMIFQIILNGILLGGTLNALFGLGEELGWRGFLFSATKQLPIWKSGLLIGFFWGLWHAPLVLQGYNFPNFRILGVFLMAIACAPLGLMMSILVKSGKSVVIAAIFHGVYNAVAGASILFISDSVEWLHGPFGLLAIVVYSCVAFLAWIWDRKSNG